MEIVTQAFLECDPWMYPVMFGAVIIVATVLERTLYLFFTSRINDEAFMTALSKLIREGTLDRALTLAKAASTSVVGEVVFAGLERKTDGTEFVRRAMAEATLRTRPKLRRRLFSLALFGLGTLGIGIYGSMQLGGLEPLTGTPTPLPLGQPMAMAPAMAGAAVGAVAIVAALVYRLRVKQVEDGLARNTERLILMLQNRPR